ncbi:FAD-dependent oxidoreductase, partial [Streptosporangium canum]|uniref:FAD-dependent oxidoreductase n=1 Tax=Streptosporangium canum TaxID=324952 RepID=UPI0036C1E8B7
MSDSCCGTTPSLELEQVPAAGDAGALPVVVIGAGPIGLAAAAHLAERGQDFLLLEAGEQVA